MARNQYQHAGPNVLVVYLPGHAEFIGDFLKAFGEAGPRECLAPGRKTGAHKKPLRIAVTEIVRFLDEVILATEIAGYRGDDADRVRAIKGQNV